jgi:hypothetical protein
MWELSGTMGRLELGSRNMSRSHGSLVIYGDEMELPPESVEKLECFSRWLTNELAVLETRWQAQAAPLARAGWKQESTSR